MTKEERLLEDAKTIAGEYSLEWEVEKRYKEIIEEGETPEFAYTMALTEWDL